MGREDYDRSRAEDIARRARTVDAQSVFGPAGLALELRPIPGEEREHVLDPHIFEMCKKRLSGAVVTPAFSDVTVFRKNPPKENYELDSGAVDVEPLLMDFGVRRIPAFVFTPQGEATARPCLIYYHGGGFTVGDGTQLRNFCRYLAERANCVVIHPNYRLAPEDPFPAAVDDCSATLSWVIEHASELSIDASRIALAGDSAGGSLANAVVQRHAHDEHIKLVALIYPMVDGGPVPDEWSYDLYPVIDEHAAGVRLRVDRIKDANDDMVGMLCMGDAELACDPLISAAYASDLSIWPRTLVIGSEYDYLRYQDEHFAAALADAGVEVRAIRYLGMDHGFIEQIGVIPQSEDLCNVIADEIAAL